MTRFAALVLFAAAASTVSPPGERAAAAPIPKQAKDANPDLTKLQGTWELSDIAVNGASVGADLIATVATSMEVRDDTVVITANGQQKMRTTSKLKFDLTTNPRRVTYTDTKHTDFDGKPVDLPVPEKGANAIYKFDGDTFVVATTGDGKDPPADFDAKPGSIVAVVTFKRVKK